MCGAMRRSDPTLRSNCRGGDEKYRKEKQHLCDLRDPQQWEIISEIEMTFNRLVMYPGQLFHAITPIFFGDSIENTRLTQNPFIYREPDMARV
jgi:hypothetical protein